MVDSVFLYPIEGSLDASAIEVFLAQQPDVLPDPLGTGTYLVCGIPEVKELIREQRLANPSEFPYVVLVAVSLERVNIYQKWGDEDGLRSARNITRWILEHNRCRVMDEYYDDWTERVAQRGVETLYPESLA